MLEISIDMRKANAYNKSVNCLRIYHGTRFCFRQHFQVQYIDIFALNGIHSTTKDIAAIA